MDFPAILKPESRKSLVVSFWSESKMLSTEEVSNAAALHSPFWLLASGFLLLAPAGVTAEWRA
jgi:hypothetical protein